MKKYFKENKTVLLAFITLAWPTVLEQFLSTIVQYVDTAMVGRLGASATATVSLSSTYNWTINSVIYSLGIGFLSYIARAIGEKNQEKITKAAHQAILAALGAGIFLTIVTMSIAPYMPIWMGADPSIRRDGSIYFTLINLPILLRSGMVIFGAAIRSTGDTKTPMRINVFMNILNTCLNYVFIYMLAFGAIGAGIATAISYSVGSILTVIAFLRNPILKVDLKHIKFDKPVMSDCLRIGIPVMFTQFVSCSGYIVATSLVSSMKTTIYAAHSIAITAETIFYIPGYGMQAATSTLIGNAIGEKNRKKEHSVMVLSISIVFALMCISGIALFVGADAMMRIFTKDPQVIKIGTTLLRIVAFTEPIFGSAAVMDGIYAGMGRTKYPLVVELITRWGIRILGSFIFVRILGMGINHVWYCMIGDNITKAALLAIGILFLIRTKRE